MSFCTLPSWAANNGVNLNKNASFICAFAALIVAQPPATFLLGFINVSKLVQFSVFVLEKLFQLARVIRCITKNRQQTIDVSAVFT